MHLVEKQELAWLMITTSFQPLTRATFTRKILLRVFKIVSDTIPAAQYLGLSQREWMKKTRLEQVLCIFLIVSQLSYALLIRST